MRQEAKRPYKNLCALCGLCGSILGLLGGPAMKIVKIETFKYWASWCNWLFVKVSTDDGLYGWGEGSLHGAIESVETAIH
jgi:hypothetical protein